MIFFLYRCIIWLHPRAFRRRFGDEMLWIFEEAAKETNTVMLLADGLASLGRQWATNPIVWKVPVIAIGALLPFFCLAFLPRSYGALDRVSVLGAPGFLLIAIVAPLVTVSFGLVFSVSWFRFVQRRSRK